MPRHTQKKNTIAIDKNRLNDDVDDKDKPKIKNNFFHTYIFRGGPNNPGSKQVPIGNKTCLVGINFFNTEVLDSLDRKECYEIIKKYGGRVYYDVTKYLDYLLMHISWSSKTGKSAQIKHHDAKE